MNVFGVIILAALLLNYTLELGANLLNLKALSFELPPALAGIFKAEEYRKSQEYVRAQTRFSLASHTFALVLLLAFWFLRGFDLVDQLVRGWALGPIASGVLFIGILFIAYTIVMLPFSIYGTFVLEERFGFNRTTARTFVLDRVKGLGLAASLGGPLLAAVLALFQYAGSYAWLYCWAAVTLFSLVMQYLAPTLIMPLFNKYTTMAPGELKEAIMNYTRSVNFPVRNVFVMDGSKRSSRSNAFFTGFGRYKRIALFDTLIAQHPVSELVAILAHEVGHYKKKHILQGTIIGIVHTGFLFFLLSVFLDSPGLYQAFYVRQESVYTGLLFFSLLYTPLEMALSVALNAFSRKNEREADSFAVETTADPGSVVEALKRLYTLNLSNLTPHPFFVFLNYSHPPLLQRMAAVQALRADETANR